MYLFDMKCENKYYEMMEVLKWLLNLTSYFNSFNWLFSKYIDFFLFKNCLSFLSLVHLSLSFVAFLVFISSEPGGEIMLCDDVVTPEHLSSPHWIMITILQLRPAPSLPCPTHPPTSSIMWFPPTSPICSINQLEMCCISSLPETKAHRRLLLFSLLSLFFSLRFILSLA